MRPLTAFRLRRPRRPLRPFWGVLAGAALLTGAGINGWHWLPTGWAVVSQVKRAGAALPPASPLRGRVLFISPHPDDETLAAAGILQAVRARGEEVFVVFLTSGDGFPWDVRTQTARPLLTHNDYLRLGRMRMAEARRAVARLGIAPQHVYFLGFPDRGLAKLGGPNDLAALRSPYTGADRVPYDGVYAPGASYSGKTLDSLLRGVFQEVRPSVVLAPSLLDGHPDHRAASALATRLVRAGGERLYYYVVHGGLEWPLPKGRHPDLPLAPPRPLEQGVHWQRFALSSAQQRGKEDAIRAYGSQLRLLSRFMWAFARQNELLLPAPETP